MMAASTSSPDKARLIREHAEKACRTEMANVPPEIPYTVVDLVGKGSFGSVFKGVYNETGQVFAIKSLDLDQDDDEIADIQKEIGLLSQLKAGDAPNITAFHGSYVLGHKLWIIMDFCSGGSMRTLMKAGPIEERYIAVVIRETLTALQYLHSQGIIHRDIKAANILVNQDGRVQLCDFGVSAQLQGKTNKRNTFVGTPQWMAPEALSGGLYDYKIDIWSFGITIYEMAKQNPPLYQYHPERVVDMIPRLPPPRLEGGNWSNGLREFVALCLNEVGELRPSAEELQKSKFVKATRAPYTIMQDLTRRYEQWENGGGVRASMLYGPGMGGADTGPDAPNDTAWDFDIIKSRVSGVPKEFEMLSVIQRQTLRGPYRPSHHASAQDPPAQFPQGFKPRGGAEKLFRLFRDPNDDDAESWNDETPTFRGNGNHASVMKSENSGSNSSLGMISIPSFDENGMLVPDSSNSHNSNNRSPSPIGMISMPTEEELMTMALQKAAATATAASGPSHISSSIPPMSMPPMADKPTITRTRPQKSDSAGTPVLPPAEGDESFSQTIARDPSPRRPAVAASAPSSPPRYQGHQQGNITSSGMNGHKPHHLSSKSVPTFAGLREEPAPPMPAPPKVRSAESTPGPHLKSRSQDITGRGQRPGGKPHARPSHLNLGPSSSSYFIESTKLPPSPGRAVTSSANLTAKHVFGFPAMSTPLMTPQHGAQDTGILEFPVMAPLDTAVLSLSSGNEEMMRELNRVLTGLGDALEVVEVNFGLLQKARQQNIPADEEE